MSYFNNPLRARTSPATRRTYTSNYLNNNNNNSNFTRRIAQSLGYNKNMINNSSGEQRDLIAIGGVAEYDGLSDEDLQR